MSDIVNIRRRASSLDASPQFDSYSKVIIHVSDETIVTVGDDTGRTLEIDNPFGTQQMAADILARLRGYQYQPYEADGALLDPAAEIGDGVAIGNIYGGIYRRGTSFNRLMASTISAPHDEEINHEYAFESPTERQFKRQISDVKASLRIANDRIDASVEKTGGEQSSFGWSLTSDAHRWYANGREVMSVTASGLTVRGVVEATSGKIGGFTISATAIYNNISQFGGTQSSGVYIGPDGIQLGQSFRVTPYGAVTADNITANNMTLNGTLLVGGSYISASTLRSGAQSAYNNGSYWTGGSGYGYSYNNATSQYSGSYPTYFQANVVNAASSFRLGGYRAYWGTITLGTRSWNVLMQGAYTG